MAVDQEEEAAHVEEAEVREEGVAHDRRWGMWAEGADGLQWEMPGAPPHGLSLRDPICRDPPWGTPAVPDQVAPSAPRVETSVHRVEGQTCHDLPESRIDLPCALRTMSVPSIDHPEELQVAVGPISEANQAEIDQAWVGAGLAWATDPVWPERIDLQPCPV